MPDTSQQGGASQWGLQNNFYRITENASLKPRFLDNYKT
jgi:hypothetical protein